MGNIVRCLMNDGVRLGVSSRALGKLVKEDVMQPFVGMWMATFVLLPIGIFLTYKAMNDSQLFNREFYNRLLKKFRKPKAAENKV